ncbi:afadin isoform X2 [Chironomus tepperi]|uniref:afadin isoform X2 n=1 Tax=Chironomus tepperi TaxID=113505 RepID=UPI00391F36F4
MTMSLNEKRMLDREALRTVIQQWNANRLDLFELSEPSENLEFHGVMRFYFQDVGQKVATKCIRVQSDATVADVIETLIEKFRPDMRMLSVPNYALYEVHANGEERKLNPDEKPLLVQLNWHVDDREGRFLLKDLDQKPTTLDSTDTNFKRKLSKREKKEQKKKEKLQKLNSNADESENHVAEKLYTELPETSFTRSISNPEAVMRRRRQQKLEKKLQQFRSRDGQPDTGGTLKIYGESLCREVPYKTLLLSIRDCAQAVVREMLSKYGMEKTDDRHFCLVQVNSDGSEYILDDDECPLSILMNHPTSRGSIMFHVRRRPADSQPRRRKKKPLGISNGSGNMTAEREGPMLVEITHSGDGGRRVKLTIEPIEVGSANTNALQLFGPSIQPRHCLISLHEGVCTVTPLHADGLTFVNGHHITQPTILHNGSVVMFGRTASYRFVDVPSDGRYNLALSQSQLDSAYLYESRSATNPPSWHEDEDTSISSSNYTNKKQQAIPQKAMQMTQQQPQQVITHSQQQHSPGSNELKLTAQQSSDDKSMFDNDAGNIENETKSVSSMRSQDSRSQSFAKQSAGMSATPTMLEQQGQEAILPAVLEFPEHSQEQFLKSVITELDVNAPNFKLAPVYTLYLCARYRASTHYRPDLQPTERAHKLTVFLHHVANLIHNIIQEKYNDPKILSFWMANSSEFLHFLKSDRHISAFSVQAQEVLAECVQAAFQNLVSIFHSELSQTLNQFLSENIDHDSAAGLVLSVLGSAMALLRRCRVNAALTIQLFSQLFHYINVVCFNKFVTTSHMCTSTWGKALSDRLALLELWAEKQGLELAADCHLAKINQCAEFLQAPKTSVTEVQQLACSCFRLNSLQMASLLSQETISRALIDATVRMAESVADELTRADGREIRLEESPDLPLALLLPVDGFSCDVVRGIPAGLVDFLSQFQSAGWCRLASQPTSIGLWTVYMHQFNGRSPSVMSTKMPQPEVQTIKLHKNSNGMGLSIVAAKGAGQERLGIYIKSVVAGGAADADGRLQAGDQLLRVDGQSLIGITQERAADYLVRTGPIVTLEVAKQGAIFHGLATLLQQPSPVIQRGGRRMSERDMTKVGAEAKPPIAGSQLLNSKSVPALHHIGNASNKSKSTQNLTAQSSSSAGNINTSANDQGFYQNLSVYRQQNQSHPNLGDNRSMNHQVTPQVAQMGNSMGNSSNVPTTINSMNRPTSAYFNSSNNSNVMNLSSTPSIPNTTQSTSTGNLMGFNHNNTNNMMPTPAQQHLSHPNLGGMSNASSSITNSPITPHRPPIMPNKMTQQNVGFIRDARMNTQQQMMAPSMPNIAHTSSGYATNIPASQSMQSVNQIPGNYYMPQQQFQDPVQQMQYQQQQQHNPQLSPNHQASLLRGTAKMAEMGELLKRQQRNHPINGPIPFANSMDNIHIPQSNMPPPQMLSPNTQNRQVFHPQSPQKQLAPNTAPKPQRIEDQPPLPPTSTHPLFKNGTPQQSSSQVAPALNYSATEAPKTALYPTQPNTGKNAPASNPWEREEREKELEIRREQIRQWRDQQIVELSLQPSRTPQQEEQLKTLVLERDFERRAQEEENEEENDMQYQKNNSAVQEVLRLQSNSVNPSQITVPTTRLKQVDIKTTPTNISPASSDISPIATDNISQSTLPPPVQPKSILKSTNAYNNSNPSSPSKHGKVTSFASQHHIDTKTQNLTEITMNNTNANQMLTQLNKEMNELTIEYQSDEQNNPPPPPPERGSSFAVMQHQKIRSSGTFQKLSFNEHPIITNTNTKYITSNEHSPMLSPTTMTGPGNFTAHQIQQQLNLINNNNNNAMPFIRDNKRVSFHDHENNNTYDMSSSSEHDLSAIREDPSRFLDETTAMLQSPQTPEMSDTNWSGGMQSTPGVIGAQEVYRDPRQRRLAEQQQKKTETPVPEKLSFKEKMKMFALESGEDNTPKDKLKISRAQRDIDAVH